MRRLNPGLARNVGPCAVLAALLALAGCGSAPQQPAPAARPPAAKAPPKPQEAGVPVLPPANSGRGGYYQDDGPGENPPSNLMATPDAEVRNEPPNPRNSKPYVVFGKTYTPITDLNKPFVQRGLGTWYGKKFHGQRTSSGEIYDMYKMSAAHPTLPIPSYAKVTNLDNGNQVVVRVNDRGPFHSTRVIDVSYTAALKLGLLGKGSHQLEVERILPAEVERINSARGKDSGKDKAAVVAAPAQMPPPKPRAPVETAAILYPAPPSGVAAAPAAGASAAGAVAADAASALQPLQAMPRAAPLILTPVSGAEAGVSAAALTLPAGGGAPAAATPAAAVPAAAGGFYLQLGAYGRKENAEAVRAKLAMDGALNGLEIVPSGEVHRLYAGPYASRQDAAQAIPGLPSSMGLKPLIIQR
ncbi:hypothetical protein ASD15_26055 [Massilia sp. Root351]|nr:hypothetical protein ASD15_26055 [Massilia sp. Root351]